ncbi:hypothetical protein MPR_2065 [Myroides profundi]|nr:hypothetical protein MPR_2065 [Myroides profundi]
MKFAKKNRANSLTTLKTIGNKVQENVTIALKVDNINPINN